MSRTPIAEFVADNRTVDQNKALLAQYKDDMSLSPKKRAIVNAVIDYANDYLAKKSPSLLRVIGETGLEVLKFGWSLVTKRAPQQQEAAPNPALFYQNIRSVLQNVHLSDLLFLRLVERRICASSFEGDPAKRLRVCEIVNEYKAPLMQPYIHAVNISALASIGFGLYLACDPGVSGLWALAFLGAGVAGMVNSQAIVESPLDLSLRCTSTDGRLSPSSAPTPVLAAVVTTPVASSTPAASSPPLQLGASASP